MYRTPAAIFTIAAVLVVYCLKPHATPKASTCATPLLRTRTLPHESGPLRTPYVLVSRQVAPRNAVSLSDTNPYGSHSPFPGGGRRGGRGAQAAQPDPSASTVPPFVALVALSGDGSAMATVDLR